MIILSVHPDTITNQFMASDLLAACSAVPFTIAAVQEVSIGMFSEALPAFEQRGYRSAFSPYGPMTLGNVGMLLLWDPQLCALEKLEHDHMPNTGKNWFAQCARPPNIAQVATFATQGGTEAKRVQVLNYRVPVALASDALPLSKVDVTAHPFLCVSGLHRPDAASVALSSSKYLNACVCSNKSINPDSDAIFFRGIDAITAHRFSEGLTESGLRYKRLDWNETPKHL